MKKHIVLSKETIALDGQVTQVSAKMPSLVCAIMLNKWYDYLLSQGLSKDWYSEYLRLLKRGSYDVELRNTSNGLALENRKVNAEKTINGLKSRPSITSPHLIKQAEGELANIEEQIKENSSLTNDTFRSDWLNHVVTYWEVFQSFLGTLDLDEYIPEKDVPDKKPEGFPSATTWIKDEYRELVAVQIWVHINYPVICTLISLMSTRVRSSVKEKKTFELLIEGTPLYSKYAGVFDMTYTYIRRLSPNVSGMPATSLLTEKQIYHRSVALFFVKTICKEYVSKHTLLAQKCYKVTTACASLPGRTHQHTTSKAAVSPAVNLRSPSPAAVALGDMFIDMYASTAPANLFKFVKANLHALNTDDGAYLRCAVIKRLLTTMTLTVDSHHKQEEGYPENVYLAAHALLKNKGLNALATSMVSILVEDTFKIEGYAITTTPLASTLSDELLMVTSFKWVCHNSKGVVNPPPGILLEITEFFSDIN